MLRWILLFVFLMFAGLMALAAFLVQTFGWLAFVAVLATGAVFAYVLARFLPRFLFATFTAPLRRMGEVLEGASVRVNSFVAADAPLDFDTDDYGDMPRSGDELQRAYGKVHAISWFTLDVTITPASSLRKEPEELTGKKWQPDALMIVSADTEGSPLPAFMRGLANLTGGPMCLIAERLIWDGLEFVVHDSEEIWGIQRLRLHVGVPEGIQRIAFVYQMFARFGDITVPPHNSTSNR